MSGGCFDVLAVPLCPWVFFSCFFLVSSGWVFCGGFVAFVCGLVLCWVGWWLCALCSLAVVGSFSLICSFKKKSKPNELIKQKNHHKNEADFYFETLDSFI